MAMRYIGGGVGHVTIEPLDPPACEEHDDEMEIEDIDHDQAPGDQFEEGRLNDEEAEPLDDEEHGDEDEVENSSDDEDKEDGSDVESDESTGTDSEDATDDLDGILG